MKYKPENFDLKLIKLIPVDEFIEKILYHREFGYYTKKIPFGKKGDFVTAPTISNLFSEIVTIWLISCWEKFGKPKISILLNLVLEMVVLQKFWLIQ